MSFARDVPFDDSSSFYSAKSKKDAGSSDEDLHSDIFSQAHDRNTQSQQEVAADSPVERPQTVGGEIIFIAVLCCSQLLTQAGLAQSIVPQHIIARSFGVDNEPALQGWFSAGYSLTVGTFILIAGRLGDVFGHKPFFIGGYLWYALWSLITGFSIYSRNSSFFIFCRVMQGIGPAFLLPNAIAILSRAYEPGLRQNMIFSLFGATAPNGFLLGAVFSSLLSQLVWWPWAYWVMSIACLVLALLGVSAVPSTPVPKAEPGSPSIWQRVDIFGSVIGVTALVLFNFAWNQAGVVGWPEPYTYIILIMGVLLFVVFIIVEKHVPQPLIPFDFLHVESLFTLACVSAGWASFGIYIFYSLSILEVLRGQSPLYTAAQYSPVSISGLLAAGTTGLLLSKFRASTVMLMSMTFFLTGGIIFATLPVHQTYWAQTFVAIVILPWGMDTSFPASTIIMSRSLPRRHQGVAASLVNTFINYSISIGLGFAGTVEGQVNNGGKSILLGYRGALYLGVGLSGLGVIVALLFCFVERHQSNTAEQVTREKCENCESREASV